MTSDDVSRREDDSNLIRLIDQVDAKVNLMDAKLDHIVEQFRLGIEAVVNRQDDRWTLVEQRLDMGTREQNQSIRLLTAMAEKAEKGSEALEAAVVDLRQDHALTKNHQVETDKQVAEIRETLRWISRAVAGMLLTMIGTLLTGLLIFVLTH